MFTNLLLLASPRDWYDELLQYRATTRDRVRRRPHRALRGEWLPPVESLEARALLSVVAGPIAPTVYVNSVGFYYGTPLQNSQLSGAATVNGQTVPGKFTWDAGVGTVLHAGNYTEGVTFTPTDTTDYTSVDTTAQVTVGPAPLSPPNGLITLGATYGTAVNTIPLTSLPLPTSLVTGLQVPGTWAFSGPYPIGYPILPVARFPYSLNVGFTPTNASDYLGASTIVNVSIVKAQLTPIVSPVTITYGTPTPTSFLGTATLMYNGQPSPIQVILVPSAPLPNSLPVGQYSESVYNLYDSNPNYTIGSASVAITVTQATPTVTVNPVTFTYGTALNNSQLSGNATWTVNGQLMNVPGTFTYANAGTILGPGVGQVESVTFTPTDSLDYTTVVFNVVVNVGGVPVTPAVPVNLPSNRH